MTDRNSPEEIQDDDLDNVQGAGLGFLKKAAKKVKKGVNKAKKKAKGTVPDLPRPPMPKPPGL